MGLRAPRTSGRGSTTMRRRATILSLALAAGLGSCAFNPFEAEGMDHGDARLAALPQPAAVGDNPTGNVPLGLETTRDGVILVPAGYDPAVPMPLLVLLHGAGGSAAQIAGTHEHLADSLGVIVLAVDSRAYTWDAIIAFFSYDIEFINEALASVLSRYHVDRARIGLAGFSDGASYAMSLGLANGDIFRKVIVHSPGIRYRVRMVGRPAFFVAHGRDDDVLPFGATERSFVPFLEASGHAVIFRPFDGPHAISLANIRESLAWLAAED